MKAAVLRTPGTPEAGNFADPQPLPGHHVVAVTAAPVNAIDVAIASGRHPMSPRELPVVPGLDGVGVLDDGRRVYFSRPVTPYGSMAQHTLVADPFVTELPDTVDDAVAAALGNAGLAALMPLSSTARLQPGETVVVLGATGVVGRLAVQVAKLLGAGVVVAVGRDPQALEATRLLGADTTIQFNTVADPTAAIREAVGGRTVDVIVDYTWGQPAEAALRASGPTTRLVQVGERAGQTNISAQILRTTGASIQGFMPPHAGPIAMTQAYQRLLGWAADGSLRVAVQRFPLDQVAHAWGLAATFRDRVVLVP